MLLFEPEQTHFDLRWRMFGTDIRIHPLFWVVSMFMGWSALDNGPAYLALWIGCVFISILVHEFGHVVVGRWFGSDGHIVLYSFGGLAVGSNRLSNRWQRIAVCFAGPLADFLLLGLFYLLLLLLNPARADALLGIIANLFQIDKPVALEYLTVTPLNDLMWNLVVINLFWGLINLLPVYPLDGGQISRDLFGWLVPSNSLRISLGLSIFVAGLLAINALVDYSRGQPLISFLPGGGLYMALLFGLLAFSNFQELQQISSKPWREEYPEPWERDADYWKRR